MNSLRRWLYRPKKTDTSLLAKFYFSDEELNFVAAELDSFDGRKDPERCTTLVNKLRNCQDKVLVIIQTIIDDAVGDQKASRDYRVKFPDDVQQENLAGQLWFGAECLAAGSSIMNREVESACMRPLARALTKNLDSLRTLLREQCLRNLNTYTERIKEALVIFDKLFAEFELRYVSAMVPVKSMKDYDLLQEITVLFSETVQRALREKLLTQEMIDDYDPALMFTIPRLAMISGLLVFPEGPLNPDMQPSNMSEMFRPFQTLLLKIRELLYTLSSQELHALEKALCSADEPDLPTPTSNLTSQISQTDPGYEDSLNPSNSSLFPDGSVKLEDLSDILHHTPDSGSPVTPVTPVIDPGTSDFPMFPSQTIGHFHVQEQDGSPTETLINSMEENEESLNSSLNKSESKDSGLHSENVSTSDTVLVEACALASNAMKDQTSELVSPESDENSQGTASSIADETLQNICMKSCCYPENDSCVLCRQILDDLVDQVILGLSQQNPVFERQHSCPYNLDFEIPRISITDLPSADSSSLQVINSMDIDDTVERHKVYEANWENSASPTGDSAVLDQKGTYNSAHGASSEANLTTCDNCSACSNKTLTSDTPCDISVACPNHVSCCCSKTSDISNNDAISGNEESSLGRSNSVVEDKCSCSNGYTKNVTGDCGALNVNHTPSETTCDCDCATFGSDRARSGKEKGAVKGISKNATDSNSICDEEPKSTHQHSKEVSSDKSELKNDEDTNIVSSDNSIVHTTLADGSHSPRPDSLGSGRSPMHTQEESSSGNNTLETPRIQRLRYTESVSSSYSSNNDNEWDSSGGSSETSSYNSECPDEEEIALAIQAAEIASRTEARSRFSSSGDLIHRLFVCIAGVADQLQTNYAGDLRHILKCVFEMNSSEPLSVEEYQGKSSSPQIIPTGVQPRHRHRTHRRHRRSRVREPPTWVPDDQTTVCTSCKIPFTFVRRRHHCRNCGKIFCSRCSSNSVPLPHYGQVNPVRVCNRCFMFQVTPFTVSNE